MLVCPACGEENPDRARFCLACGESLEVAAPIGEERKVVSVLFVDLVGFTDRSDRADPEDVRATLRPYHERAKSDIERFGGTVEKFIGDAVMAVFGAPVSHEDDAERAVRSGLRILETIEELAGEGLELAVRAAVTTGEAVVALGARPERGEGIVTGDVVNTAARLQSAAPVGAVIVDEATRRSTESVITFEPLEPVAAKGKAEPIPVWRATHARSRVGQPEAATQTPFVGRDHERTLLFEMFLRAERESSVQLVTVVGEPGIGKSRLVTELRTALDDRPEVVTWRHGRCLPYGEGITFWALGEIVKAEAGILESDDQEAAAAKLAETVSALFEDESDRTWVVSRLGPLVGAGEGSAASREETFTAWRRFLEAMAAHRPCVLVVEDIHWADGALVEFLEHLLDWSMPVPLFVLCTARPELFERQQSWGGGRRNATTISLSPLSTEESGRLLQVLLDRTLLPAEVQSALLERAGGNPLYAEQFARMLAERGTIEDLAVPETVHALVAARLDTLRPELKTLLHDAAVVGRIFWSGAVAAVGGRERGETRRELNELVHREFIRPIRVSSIEGEDEFAFWHALVRDVAYQQIPRSPRAEKHLAAAGWVERTAGERVVDHAEILVYHYGEAVDLTQAARAERPEIMSEFVRFLLLAGDRASQLETSAAEAYYRRALDLSGDDEHALATARAGLAGILVHRGDVAESIELYELAIKAFRGLDERAAGRTISELATLVWALGDVVRSENLGLEAIAVLERQPPGPELVAAYGSAATRSGIGGRFADATPLIDKGLSLADELGVQDVTRLLQAQASVVGYQGDPACLDLNREAVVLGLRLGLGRSTAVTMNNLGDGLGYFVGIREALAQWDEAVEFSRGRGLKGPEMWQRGERLRALYHLGEWDELRREAEEVVAWEQRSGGGQLEVIARANLVHVLVHTGAVADAEANVDALVPPARESGDPQVLVPGLATAALVAAALGNDARALQHVVELEALTRGHPTWRDYCLVWPARVAIAAGEPELVEAFLDDKEYDAAWSRCARLTARAMLAEARGERGEASALFREAAGRWDEYGSVVERGYALLGIGRCGDAKASREGEVIFANLGASPVVARAA
ncbi:MAG: AAA family ATPase [Thermoleophilia bacterium]|nr:AAA family ATPase [Thermoleophilia bacterium]MDH4340594.1 AAA family ATPase [Thermoleophilia bacterium]